MASLIYDSFMHDIVKGDLDFDTAPIYGALVTSTYTPLKGTHDRFNDITNEVTGTGYTAGGAATTPTCTNDTTNHREDITFTSITWSTSTITARALVLYNKKGGASSADPLIAYVDFGSDVSSTAAAFSVTFTSALRFQN